MATGIFASFYDHGGRFYDRGLCFIDRDGHKYSSCASKWQSGANADTMIGETEVTTTRGRKPQLAENASHFHACSLTAIYDQYRCGFTC